ncbi:MAG: hypothetical protein A3K19_09900 [Lentisphaerae bacterium RIFOXYB12_FULL_65_16]|nr:MAG: hypothetical protein A3K18_00635 [Lentisphaerae bacterium RIFOXYA12_64_32]OGV91266.1 MAG: hypothetical protein A3K19_09900 [Lentisphaerae bacterium RIFOXYB12_FULL_65_16]
MSLNWGYISCNIMSEPKTRTPDSATADAAADGGPGRQTLVRRILGILGQGSAFPERLRVVLDCFQDAAGCEAVGLRLRTGPDFPYLAAIGFSEEHVRLESRLRKGAESHTAESGGSGAPPLECICGRVLSEKLAADSPFCSPGGSLVVNSAADFHAVAAESASSVRGRCCIEGYQSMALLPLKNGTKILGLLQVNDRRPNVFSPAVVAMIEEGAAALAVAIDGWLTQQKLQHQLEYAELLGEIIHDMGSSRDLSNTLEISLAHVEERLPADFVAVWLANEVGAGPGLLKHGPQTEAAVGAAGAENVPDLAPLLAVQTEALYVADAVQAADAALPRMLTTLHLGSAVVLPLNVEDRTAGVLLVGRTGVDDFATEEINFLQELAGHLSLAAHHMRLYQKLHNAYEGLRQSQEVVMQQERLRALGQMASGVAHDFNNTLAPILGFSDLLLMRPEMLADRARSKQYIEMINTAARDAGKVVSRLREFYRARDLNDAVAPILINRVVEQVISLTQPKWKDQVQVSGNLIEVERELQEAPVLYGNEAELREALINLVFNAVDAMPDGGRITLRTRTARHAPTAAEEEDAVTAGSPLAPGIYVVIDVEDNGAGMPPEVRHRCMEPFFSTKGSAGTGMGLATVYGTVRRHNGAVRIDSEVGRGTTISVWLPVEGTREVKKNRRHDPAADTAVLSGVRVLVVEDDPRVREVLLAFLTGEGHIVDVATNGKEGLMKFRRGGFGLVITDRSMSGGGGDQLAAAVKQASPSMPVIMLTGFSEFMKADSEKPEGVDVLVGKPISMAELRQAVAEAMGSERLTE